MKKPLLLLMVCLPLMALSQKLVKPETAFRFMSFFEESTGKYILAEKFIKNYGKEAFTSLVKKAYVVNELDNPSLSLLNVKYNLNLNIGELETLKLPIPIQPKINKLKSNIKLRTGNTVIGVGLIGTSLAVNSIHRAAADGKIDKISTRIVNIDAEYKPKVTKLERDLALNKISLSTFNSAMEALDKDKEQVVESLIDQIKKKRRSQRTVSYICAGTSLAGVVVVLTGLHRDSEGSVVLSKKMRLSTQNNNLSLAWKF